MKHFSYRISLLIFLFFSIYRIVFSADIGSDSAVTRFNNQVTLNAGDRVAGFAALQGGFQILSSVTTATWDCFFPASGTLNFNFGTLYLKEDLLTYDDSFLVNLGNIVGNNHCLEIAPTITCLPEFYGPTFNCLGTFLTSQAQGNQLETVDWSTYDNRFIAVGLSVQGSATNMLLVKSFDGTTITSKAGAILGGDSLNLVRWHPSQYTIATARPVAAAAPELAIYQYDTTAMTLTLTSSIEFGVSVFSVAWHPSGKYLAVALQNANEVQVYPVNTVGAITSTTPVATLNLTGGLRLIEPHGFEWNPTGEFLAIGTDAAAGFPEMFIAQFNATTGAFVGTPSTFTFGATMSCISWERLNSGRLAVGVSGTTNAKLRVMNFNFTTKVISQLATLSTSGNPVPNNAKWSPNGSCIATGWTNGEMNIYSYNENTQTISLSSNFKPGVTENEVSWRSDGNYLAGGGGNKALEIYKTQAGFPTITCVNWQDLKVFMNNNLCVNTGACIRFVGNCSLVGRGKSFTIKDLAQIRVAPNSSLLIKDILMDSIHDGGFILEDATSTISLSNARWHLDGDWSCNGRFDVLDYWEINGGNTTLTYNSTATSIIRANATMDFDEDIFFAYAPATSSRDLISMVDRSSQIILHNASLISTTTGLRLTKGTLTIKGKSSIFSDATNNSQAISLGDGISSANNLTLRFLPAAVLDVNSGILLHNDV